MGLDEQLDERKVKILKAIIKNYLETGVLKYTTLVVTMAAVEKLEEVYA